MSEFDQCEGLRSEVAPAPDGWEPRIIAFLCYWCSYTGADNAGTARLKYPPNVDIIRVMCSGRIDPELIMTAFATRRRRRDGVRLPHRRLPLHRRQPQDDGADAAAVAGAADFGIEPERFVHEWVSAAEGEKFARLVRQVTEQVRRLGPLDWPERMRERGVGHGLGPAAVGGER